MSAGIMSDVRLAVRQFWKSKGLASATLATLALCIGTTTAIFSMVYSLMLKPLPFHEPERIVELYSSASKAGLHKMPANVVMYLDYSRNATSYETVGLWRSTRGLFGEESAVERFDGALATAEMFEVLRVRPMLGEFFTTAHNRPGEDKVIVLTHSFWRSKFAADPGIVGREVRIDDHTYRDWSRAADVGGVRRAG